MCVVVMMYLYSALEFMKLREHETITLKMSYT